jgi:shikimate 5-dehydrogenase
MLNALKHGYISSEQPFVTTATVAHLRLHGGDETGEVSKLKQTAKVSSITLGMLGAGGMANYVVRAATCQVENISMFERRLRRTGRPDYRRQQKGEREREIDR